MLSKSGKINISVNDLSSSTSLSEKCNNEDQLKTGFEFVICGLSEGKEGFSKRDDLKKIIKIIDQKKCMFKVENLNILTSFHFNDSMEDEHYL